MSVTARYYDNLDCSGGLEASLLTGYVLSSNCSPWSHACFSDIPPQLASYIGKTSADKLGVKEMYYNSVCGGVRLSAKVSKLDICVDGKKVYWDDEGIFAGFFR